MSLLLPAFIPLSTAQTAAPSITFTITLSGSISPSATLSTTVVNNELTLFGALNFSGSLIAQLITPSPEGVSCPIVPPATDTCATVTFSATECYPITQTIDSYYYNDPITYNQMLFEGRPLVYLTGPLPPKAGSPASFIYTES